MNISVEREGKLFKVSGATFEFNGRHHEITHANFFPISNRLGKYGTQGFMSLEVDNMIYIQSGKIVKSSKNGKPVSRFFGPTTRNNKCKSGYVSYGGFTQAALDQVNDIIVEVARLIYQAITAEKNQQATPEEKQTQAV